MTRSEHDEPAARPAPHDPIPAPQTPSTGKIDEQDRRKAEWRDGSPVILADGQEWHLARPRVRFRPADNAIGWELFVTGPGDDFEQLFRERDALLDEPQVLLSKLAPLELKLTSMLLLAHYDLTPAELGRLLQFGYDADEDPEGWAIREACKDVIEGNGPKPGPAGDASPPTPPA